MILDKQIVNFLEIMGNCTNEESVLSAIIERKRCYQKIKNGTKVSGVFREHFLSTQYFLSS